MYDESIQRALRRHKIKPIELPAQFLQRIVDNFRSSDPESTILTGTPGDGKTFHKLRRVNVPELHAKLHLSYPAIATASHVA